MILKITNAVYVRDYILALTFSNGEVRNFDFATVYNEGICTKLKNMSYFKKFKLDPFSVDWNDEIGFAPEFLYENAMTS